MVLPTPHGELRQALPDVFQEHPGGTPSVRGRYRVPADGQVGIDVGEYDRSRPLVIDPVLSWASYPVGAARIEIGAACGGRPLR